MPRKAVPWHARDGGLRLAHDRSLIATAYPQLNFEINPESGQACLQGDFVYRLACNVPTRVAVRIDFPSGYPFREPHAYDMEGRFPHEADRHFYSDGRCCLWLPPESEWDARDPAALVRFIDQAFLFFDRQFVFEAQPLDRRNVWPGGERSHGVVGYLEYVRDTVGGDEGVIAALAPTLLGHKRVSRNRLCPCGSTRKYKRCHMHQVETARRSLTPDDMDALLQFLSSARPSTDQASTTVAVANE